MRKKETINAKWPFFIRIAMLAAVANESSGAQYGRYKMSNCEYFFYSILFQLFNRYELLSIPTDTKIVSE